MGPSGHFTHIGTGFHVIGTGCILGRAPRRRLCPIFVSGVGLPDIHEYSPG